MLRFRIFVALAAVGLVALSFVAVDPASAMNKAELIDAIASSARISKADARKALDAFISTTSNALKKGDRVALVGFGAFSISKGPVTDPSDPTATLPNGKRLRPIKVRYRGGNRSAGTLARGENGTWELVIGIPNESFYDETLELEVKMPKPIEPRQIDLSLRLPTNAPGTNVGAVLDGAEAEGTGAVVEITLPANTFEEISFDPLAPEPDYHAAFYQSVHADVASDPCVEAILADRLGFDGEPICPPGESCALDADKRDQLSAALQSATGLDSETISRFIDAILGLSYPPPLADADSLSGLGSVSTSQRTARTGRNPQTGKEIKIRAKKVVKFKAGSELASKVN